MQLLEKIKRNTIIIAPDTVKIKLLNLCSDTQKIYPIKWMRKEEFWNHFYFEYREEALLYLMETLHISLGIAKVMLENMYYIEDRNYLDLKLNELSHYKNELIEKELLIFDDLFSSFLENKDILVIGYSQLEKWESETLSKIGAQIPALPLMRDQYPVVYEADNLEEEVAFVFTEISELVANGVSLNDIKLANVDEDYFYTIQRLSPLFNLKVALPSSSIYSNRIVQDYLAGVREKGNFREELDCLEKKYELHREKHQELYAKLQSIIDHIASFDYPKSLMMELLEDTLKHTKISGTHYDQEIELINIEEDLILEDEYVFLLGFNQNKLPRLYKNEDYIDDSSKEEVLLYTTEEKNKNAKENLKRTLLSIRHLFLSYKNQSIREKFYPSVFLQEEAISKEKAIRQYDITYSKKYDQILLARYLDDLIKFGIHQEALEIYYHTYSINYATYDSSYQKINPPFSNIRLSYTHMDDYAHCPFRYYVSHVLKLDRYEENFSTILGNLFHYILSICFEKDFDFSSSYDEYLKNQSLQTKEKIFLTKLKEELKTIIDHVKELHQQTGLTESLLEYKVTIDKSKDIPVSFVGIIDKIMYRKNSDETLVALVDYKTGNTSIDLYRTKYGLKMQLPIYLYLVKKSELFSNPTFVGFYLQKLLGSEISFSKQKSYLQQKKQRLKLDGYSISDPAKLAVFDVGYENSQFIKSMKTSNKGFYSYAKVLTAEEMDALINWVDREIEATRDAILNAEFSISPKQIQDEKVGCEFCTFRDLCYVREKDYVKLEENRSLDFLEEVETCQNGPMNS